MRETTRDEEKCTIVLTAEISARLKKENDLKAMIYCAADPISHFTKADISFPHQIEIKINQEEVKSNLKGLKNKTGTTRPADITKLLHKGEGYQNLMAVTYALTQKVRDSLPLRLLALDFRHCWTRNFLFGSGLIEL